MYLQSSIWQADAVSVEKERRGEMKKLVVVVALFGLFLLLGALFGVQHMNEELGISQPEPLP